MIGQIISHYEILEKLGSGGMGVVYKARDTKLDRIVALKFLPPKVARDKEAKQRFMQEAKAASALDDPHICTIFEIGESEDGQLFIAMAYYDGSTLQDLIEKRQVKIDDAASIARQMAKGLSTAHEAGIVHRDVKPANVMVTRKGLVKLLDFGVAKLGESSDLTREGSTIGTASYMSPEQARGEQVDARSDIWSIGAVLYEMLTGARPFGGGYEAAVAYSIINEDPPPIAPARPDTPEGLIDVVNKALSKNAEERYPTARALADALAPYSGETIVETAPQPAYNAPAEDATPSLQKLVVRFAIGGAVALGIVYAAMIGLGLPDWVFPSAVFLTLIGLPTTLYAASLEKKRAKMDSGEKAKLQGLKAKLSTKLALRGGMYAAAGLLVVVLGYSGLRAAGIGPFASLITSGELGREDPIILTDFENNTDIPDLGSTVSSALRIDLSQSRVVNVMDRSIMSDALQRMGMRPDTLVSASLGMDIAQREGVTAIIEGNISPVGSAFQVAASVVAADDGTLLAGFRETAASEADIVGAIDRLSARMRAEIGESLVDIRSNPPLEQVSTTSLDALRHYTRGNRMQEMRRPGEAIREIEMAIEIDSLFGMAYRKLAVLYNNANTRGAYQDTLFQRAYDLRGRMTERERLTTEGSVFAEGALDIPVDYVRSRRAYETLLEQWPNDFIALNNLSIRYTNEGRYSEAEELLRRSYEILAVPFSTQQLSINLFRQGRYEESESLNNILAETNAASAFHARAASAFSLDSLDTAYRWLELRDSLWAIDNDRFTRPEFLDRGWVLASQGRYDDLKERGLDWIATSQGQQTLDFDSVPDSIRQRISNFIDWENLLNLAYATGNYEKLPAGFAELNRIAGNPQSGSIINDNGQLTWSWYDHLGLAVEMFDVAVIDSILTLTDTALSDGAQYATLGQERFLIRARAISDVVKGNSVESAIERFRANIWPNALREPFNIVGRLEEIAGNETAAIEAYTRFVTGPVFDQENDRGRMGRIHFRLGELHEEQGNLDQAIHHYQKMVDRWKDADAILQPQVEEARRRIDQLLDQKAQEPN